MRIATASDDAAYWSIATTMRSDQKALSAVEDALGMAAAVLDTANNGYQAATDILAAFKQRLVMARESGVDREKINSELTVYKEQLQTITHASSFSGENWLWRTSPADDADKALVGSFRRDSTGEIKIANVNYQIAGTPGTSNVNFLIDDLSGDGGILTGSGFATELGTAKTWVLFNSASGPAYDEMAIDNNTSSSDLDDMIKVVDAMSERTISVATTLGSLSTRIDMQTAFVKDLSDSIDFGVGRMVDADMNEESTRLKALQVQEQLGLETLSIINNDYINFFELMSR